MPAAAEKQAGEACARASRVLAIEPQESLARKVFEAEADPTPTGLSFVALSVNVHGEVAFGWQSTSEGLQQVIMSVQVAAPANSQTPAGRIRRPTESTGDTSPS